MTAVTDAVTCRGYLRERQENSVEASMNTPVTIRAPQLRSQEKTTDPDLHIVVVSFLIALLLTLCVAIRFPDLGSVIAQYNLM